MKKVIKLKIAAQMFNDLAFVNDYLLRHVKKVVDSECKFGWCSAIVVEQVFDEDSFIRNIKLLMVSFDYIPTQRIFRNTPKKKRKLINRYL